MRISNRSNNLFLKISRIHWALVFFICCAGFLGFVTLYSAAGGDFYPWSVPQAIRFSVGFCIMITFALVDINFWFRNAYAIYLVLFLVLLSVELFGISGMGAKRWVDFGFTRIQPSEMMKFGLLLALARYFHGLSLDEVKRTLFLIVPIVLLTMPVLAIFCLLYTSPSPRDRG